jgi:Fe-Mn family superoxide dismutase
MKRSSSRRELLRRAAALPLAAAATGTVAATLADAATAASTAPAPASAAGAPLVADATAGADPAPASAPAFDRVHEPRPLPFRAGSLAGLSERLVQSHWENNYVGAVKALNAVRGRLRAALADRDLPPYVYDGLKREQLLRSGSVALHESYFGNLGGGGQPGAALRSRIGAAFGSHSAWEAEFRRIALGLGGGSGWVVLGYNPSLDLLENYWLADHATAPIGVTPVLVLDMYEHAYHMDYGAAAARYVDAFFANLRWEEVARRLDSLEPARRPT